MQAKFAAAGGPVPTHHVHRLVGVVDHRRAHDAPLREVRVPAVEAIVLGLGVSQPLGPQERIRRLGLRWSFVGIVGVDRVVHRRNDHGIDGTPARYVQA